MPAIDLPLSELERYHPDPADAAEPDDFDDAWAATLAQARTVPMTPTLEPVQTGLRLVRHWDVTFPGFGGEPVRAWLSAPADVVDADGSARARLPVVVVYNGYGGGRGLPIEHTTWANAGYAELFMDTRGQGAAWGSGGHTPDPHGSDPSGKGWMTQGVASFEGSYFRRLVTDAVRAVDAVRTLDVVDPERVAVAGVSQGGGLALASAGLSDGLVAAMPDVPFLCHIRRGVDISPADPYAEVSRYLAVHRGAVEQVMRTLSYVDGMHHAARADAPALFSVALWDEVCPPSTVYAAYHAYGSRAADGGAGGTAVRKEIAVYPYNHHEGGQSIQVARQLQWLRDVAGVVPEPA